MGIEVSAAATEPWTPDALEYTTSVSVPAAPLRRPSPSCAMVVVVAAGGGVGRSTTADLLAHGLCGRGPLLLVDGAPGMFSPRRVLPRGRDGLAAVDVGDDDRYWVLGPDGPLVRHDALTAVDAADADWATYVVDTYDPVLHLVDDGRWRHALTRPWVRVVLATASAAGPLGQAVAAAEMLRQAGVPVEALTGAVLDVSAGRGAGPGKEKITLLGGGCGSVARVPHLPSVRAAGRLVGGDADRGARRAAALLAQRVAVEEAA
jgi:Mrp family chromosome partitioning ATPase